MNADAQPRSEARGLTSASLCNCEVFNLIALRSPGDRASGAAARSLSWSCSGKGEQIVGDDTQAYPPLPTRAAVPTSSQPVATFERADASFTAGAPAERRLSGSRACFTRLEWQHDALDDD